MDMVRGSFSLVPHAPAKRVTTNRVESQGNFEISEKIGLFGGLAADDIDAVFAASLGSQQSVVSPCEQIVNS